MVVPLTKLMPGESATVVWLAGSPSITQRLHDLGFSSGALITCSLKPSRTGMSAYLVRHAQIALRAEQAREIFVQIEAAWYDKPKQPRPVPETQ